MNNIEGQLWSGSRLIHQCGYNIFNISKCFIFQIFELLCYGHHVLVDTTLHIEQHTTSLLLLCYGHHVLVDTTLHIEQYTTSLLLLCYGHHVLVDTTLHIEQYTTSLFIVMLWPPKYLVDTNTNNNMSSCTTSLLLLVYMATKYLWTLTLTILGQVVQLPYYC